AGNFNRTVYAVGLVGSPASIAICAPGGSMGGAGPHVASLSSAITCVFCELTGLTNPPKKKTATAVITETVVFIIPPLSYCASGRASTAGAKYDKAAFAWLPSARSTHQSVQLVDFVQPLGQLD